MFHKEWSDTMFLFLMVAQEEYNIRLIHQRWLVALNAKCKESMYKGFRTSQVRYWQTLPGIHLVSEILLFLYKMAIDECLTSRRIDAYPDPSSAALAACMISYVSGSFRGQILNCFRSKVDFHYSFPLHNECILIRSSSSKTSSKNCFLNYSVMSKTNSCKG